MLKKFFAAAVCCAAFTAAATPTLDDALRLAADDNTRESFEACRALLRDTAAPAAELNRAQAVILGTACLHVLSRQDEIDAFLDEVLALDPASLPVRLAVSRILINNARIELPGARKNGSKVMYVSLDSGGAFKNGHFSRGTWSGGSGGDCAERDRSRALILLAALLPRVEAAPAPIKSDFYRLLSDALFRGGRDSTCSWRLQELTPLDKPCEVEYGAEALHPYSAAPVDDNGNPIFYKVPASFAAAANDGERWRWAIARLAESAPDEARRMLGGFAQEQFGVTTLRASDPEVRSLDTLADDETCARLANGPRRFKLPPDYNYIALALTNADFEFVAQAYLERRQFDKAAALYARLENQRQLDKIAAPAVRLETVTSGSAATIPSFDLVFRNATNVHFRVRRVDFDRRLADLKKYLASNPKEIEYWQARLFDDRTFLYLSDTNLTHYVGATVTEWDAPLVPRPGHLDRRVSLRAPRPLPAGTYLLSAAAGTNSESGLVFVLDDLVLVQRPAGLARSHAGQSVFVTDAESGRPVPDAVVELFAWARADGPRVKTASRTYRTDSCGRATIPDDVFAAMFGKKDHYWTLEGILSVRTPDGRTAAADYNRWSSLYCGRSGPESTERCRALLMTDRPAYRPGNVARFKIWATEPDYGAATNSPFAGHSISVMIRNPKDDAVLSTNLVADAFGGVSGEFAVPASAPLGVYTVSVTASAASGAGIRDSPCGILRVEEYRKPEFAVAVDTPTNSVRLGETVRATVRATYNWGAPVAGGTAKITVTRTAKVSSWWPVRPWDWLYGNGYAWYCYDYDWYPAWSRWGFCRPRFAWCWFAPQPPPEEVVKMVRPLRPDGTVEVVWPTASAKALYGDDDQSYHVAAEVTDSSRRVIDGAGDVTVSAQPFRVFAWSDRPYCRVGSVIRLYGHAVTASGTPVAIRRREAELFRIDYGPEGTPRETSVRTWSDGDETASLGPDTVWKFSATARGQYRAVVRITAADGTVEEGAQLLTIRGTGDDGRGFRFAALELVPDKSEYAPGETVHLSINTEATNATVFLFIRPERLTTQAGGVSQGKVNTPRRAADVSSPNVSNVSAFCIVSIPPTGKCAIVDIPVTAADRPDFFVEAFTVHGGKFFSEVRRIVVPPENRISNVAVEIDGGKTAAAPGDKMALLVRVTDAAGKPVSGTAALTVYDRAIDRLAGGSNVPDIRTYFWGWTYEYRTSLTTSLDPHTDCARAPCGHEQLSPLGLFGFLIADEESGQFSARTRDEMSSSVLMRSLGGVGNSYTYAGRPRHMKTKAVGDLCAAPLDGTIHLMEAYSFVETDAQFRIPSAAPAAVHVRSRFADTAAWFPILDAVSPGVYRASFTLPEDVTGWRVRAWTMAPGARVGEGEASFVTVKEVICRLEAPRFLTEGDEAVLSAVVHSSLKSAAAFDVSLVVTGAAVKVASPLRQRVEIAAGGEARVDWRIRALAPGDLVVRMSAVSSAGSDALERSLPVQAHGILRTESFSRMIRPGVTDAAVIPFAIPTNRNPALSRLEVRWSPSLAGAMLDAIPYLLDYPYGCTEQTLNRFLPAVVARKALKDSGLDLAAFAAHRTNLNPQEIGSDTNRLAQWKRYACSPVFDPAEMDRIVRTGLDRLASMQLSSGAWGWFSGRGEWPDPHMTAILVLGLAAARASGVAVPPFLLDHGADWLANNEQERVDYILLKRKERRADAGDAFTAYALARVGKGSPRMRDLLYEDRAELPFYAKAVLGLAFDAVKDAPRRDMMVRNIKQYLHEDPENQSAWFELGNGAYWWWWYGNDIESQTAGLALLMTTEPQGTAAAGLVKYILNNRRYGTCWNSTRDTAFALQVLADYFVKVESPQGRASGPARAAGVSSTVTVSLDGRVVKTSAISPENPFAFDNAFVLEGAALAAGPHTLTVARTGTGPLYLNAYVSNFTKEDPITAAGLEIKVNRTVRRLDEKTVTAGGVGSRGQVVARNRGAVVGTVLKDGDAVKSGDLLEVTLSLESKNDYEYLAFEDMKPAGCESVEFLSGYTEAGGIWPYVEYRDNRVIFFVRRLPRGTAQIVYRLRAETPGTFHALPAQAAALYAPELKANSDEFHLSIAD